MLFLFLDKPLFSLIDTGNKNTVVQEIKDNSLIMINAYRIHEKKYEAFDQEEIYGLLRMKMILLQSNEY